MGTSGVSWSAFHRLEDFKNGDLINGQNGVPEVFEVRADRMRGKTLSLILGQEDRLIESSDPKLWKIGTRRAITADCIEELSENATYQTQVSLVTCRPDPPEDSRQSTVQLLEQSPRGLNVENGRRDLVVAEPHFMKPGRPYEVVADGNDQLWLRGDAPWILTGLHMTQADRFCLELTNPDSGVRVSYDAPIRNASRGARIRGLKTNTEDLPPEQRDALTAYWQAVQDHQDNTGFNPF
ncbi:MAG: hypothetical protein IPK79_04315 [Vampirovibrionales bacterium]|nr:hypothetical protein [Vampirovibrionales bacterium]